jgi:hypothetical protein
MHTPPRLNKYHKLQNSNWYGSGWIQDWSPNFHRTHPQQYNTVTLKMKVGCNKFCLALLETIHGKSIGGW